MKNYGTAAAVTGTALNFTLFLIKVYIGISSNSLSIYCDAINNLGDMFACIIAIVGFFLVRKYSERQSDRTQSIFTFVIDLIIAVTGTYFVYNGFERVLYPLPVSYSVKYAVVIIGTIVVKIFMAIFYSVFNRKSPSPVLKAMVTDSILDCFITLATLMSLFLVPRTEFAVDGFFAIITGLAITVSAVKNIIEQSKYLIND